MEDHHILLLAAGNIGLEAVHKWTVALAPVFTALVSLGQVAVAVVTVIYIIQKIRTFKKNNNSPP